MSIFSEAINAHFPEDWLLHFVADDHSEQLTSLINDLMRPYSETGDGKRFESGLSYWGIGPTVAWQRACNDPLYPVAQASTKEFSKALNAILVKSENTPLHYVSFGTGTGEKDAEILRYMLRNSTGAHFFPIDMSASMLSLGLREVLKAVSLKHGMLLPIQMDFSVQSKIDALRSMVEKMVDAEPVMYSCLGNTIANFMDDETLLKTLASVLRLQDRILLEVAMANEISDGSVSEATKEYSRSVYFRRFATSALLRNTDLPITDAHLELGGKVDTDGRAVQIRVLYRSVQNQSMAFTVPDQQKVDFLQNDTIRLYLSRKYCNNGLTQMLAKAGLREVQHYQYGVGTSQSGGQKLFAVRVLLAAPISAAVFLSYGHKDENFVKALAKLIRGAGLTTWVAEQSLKGDEALMSEIRTAVTNSQKVVVVLSEESKDREWVKAELRIASKIARETGKKKIFIVRLLDVDNLRNWTVLDDQGDLAATLKADYLFDFTDCNEIPSGARDWPRLEAALRANIA